MKSLITKVTLIVVLALASRISNAQETPPGGGTPSATFVQFPSTDFYMELKAGPPADTVLWVYRGSTHGWSRVARPRTIMDSLQTAVHKFNGRTGNVVPAANDYSFSQLSGTKNISLNGGTPLPWASSINSVELLPGKSLRASTSNIIGLSNNTYNDGTNAIAVATGIASFFNLATNSFSFGTSPSVTAGSVQTQTTVFNVNSTGNITTGGYQATPITNAYLNDIAWSKVTGAPTTLSGYGITDGYTLPSLTSGSLLFSNGTTITQDNSKFFWDNTNKRLGIGSNSPGYDLHIKKTGAIAYSGVSTTGAFSAGTFVENTTNGSYLQYDSFGTSTPGTIFGQPTSNTASVRLNPVSGAAGLFGTYSNADLIIGTNNNERIRIKASGEVGIGTSTPGTDLLQISKNQNSTTSFMVSNPSTLTSAYAQGSFANSSGILYHGIAGVNTPTSSVYFQNGVYSIGTAAGGYSFGSTNASGDIRFYSGGTTERMRLLAGGSLLIGSTSATAGAPKLDVTGSIGSTALTASRLVSTDANKVLTSETGTGFLKLTSGAISYDTDTYLPTSAAASTYLPLAGGALTGALTGTNITLQTNIVVAATPSSGLVTIGRGNGANTFGFKGPNGFSATFNSGPLTSNMLYSLPNATTTLAGTDNVATFTNKSMDGGNNTFTNIPWSALTGTPSFAPLSGGTDYIQNGTSQQAGSNFNISGDGTVGGIATARSFKVAGTYSGPTALSAVDATRTLSETGATVQRGVQDFSSLSNTISAGTQFTGSSMRLNIAGTNTQNLNIFGPQESIGTISAGATGTLTSFYGFRGVFNPSGMTTANATGLNYFFNANNGSTITNATGVRVVMLTSGTGTIVNKSYINLGEGLPSGSWSIYDETALNSYLSGNLQLGSSTPTSGAEKLQVTGNAIISGNGTINGATTVSGNLSVGSAASFATTLKVGTHAVPSGYKMAVEGGVIAEKVQVAAPGSSAWPDYVFAPGYKLPTLAEVEVFIQANKHLPGIPSAAEVTKNGIDLGEMNAKLLQKIEELTLQMIAQDKRLTQKEQEIETLKHMAKKTDELERKLNLLLKESNK